MVDQRIQYTPQELIHLFNSQNVEIDSEIYGPVLFIGNFVPLPLKTETSNYQFSPILIGSKKNNEEIEKPNLVLQNNIIDWSPQPLDSLKNQNETKINEEEEIKDSIEEEEEIREEIIQQEPVPQNSHLETQPQQQSFPMYNPYYSHFAPPSLAIPPYFNPMYPQMMQMYPPINQNVMRTISNPQQVSFNNQNPYFPYPPYYPQNFYIPQQEQIPQINTPPVQNHENHIKSNIPQRMASTPTEQINRKKDSKFETYYGSDYKKTEKNISSNNSNSKFTPYVPSKQNK